ncbi:hypothetical protein BB560_002318 [Smittium megazygosporum]|uniref:Dipeptidyl-peptidase V n=1 Tax=Smittium megazygosporum TaxID=133381 RepID=A0A2T9ZF50_9FUNG|nr:hypothetical protein BB560_002318 [Smittium megazygosporum]
MFSIRKIAIAFALGTCVLADVFNPDPSIFPDWSKTKRFTPVEQTQMDRMGGYDVSPNKKHVVYTHSQWDLSKNKYKRGLRLVNLEDSSSVDLTAFEFGNFDSNPIWINDDIIAFTAVRGSPSTNIFAISVSSKAVTQVTNYTNGISSISYSTAAKKFAFISDVYQGMDMEQSSTERKRRKGLPYHGVVYDQLRIRFWDTWNTDDKSRLFTMPADIVNGVLTKTGDPVNVLEKFSPQYFGLIPDSYDFSPDGKNIVFSSNIPSREQQWKSVGGIYVVPTDGSVAPVRVNNGMDGDASSPVYSPDNKYIAWLQIFNPDNNNDIRKIILYDISTDTHRKVADSFMDSPTSLKFSADCKSLYAGFALQKDVTVLKINLSNDSMTRLTGDGYLTNWSEISNEQILVVLNSFQFPDTMFLVPADGSKKKTQVTHDNDSNLKDLWFSPTESYWFTGALNQSVQALVTYPYGFDSSKKFPVALIIHGGPHSSWYDAWSYRWNINMFANQGYIPVIINFHGGNAYTQPFSNSVLMNWGTYPFEDIMKGFDYFLENAEFADKSTTVALGASYGGYMINWINGHTDRFKALVQHDGIFSTISMFYSSEIMAFSTVENGIPWIPEQRESSEKNNPERFVKNWKTPTLVVHGEKDFRVPLTEGISCFSALQRLGVESRFLYFPNENHWVLQPYNSLQWHSEVLDWIGKHTNKTNWNLSSIPSK